MMPTEQHAARHKNPKPQTLRQAQGFEEQAEVDANPKP